ncbi:MAG TPA: peptidoglycan-binding protein [Candidatus Monoglobus merdigallinarum]|uniref:Peptidoglycan-binding protein n=1 Tax=Candidatus Monoglobus merdigallinarum TaxID=2838698 RepID=A0A9D1PRC6_9FIRM|nr:peptidoglycan-binding protein [Candidatus Monoglobus merdigallinarum]
MWPIYDDRKNVYELQMLLRELSKNNNKIRMINPDGLYNSETTGAVTDVQNVNNINPTGEVDFATWKAIIKQYLDNIH